MIIAIDYDKTFTADVFLFRNFIVAAQLRCHTIICVTGRKVPIDFSRDPALPLGVVIIYAGDEEKRKAAEKADYKVDIWIDDTPETIGQCVKLQWDNP